MRNSVKHCALVVLLALLAPLPAAHCVVLTFDPMVTTNFETMTAGQAISTLAPPWTGAGASSIVAAVPAGTANSSNMAITAPGATNLTALSPQQALPAAFTGATTGDTLYFSAWLLHNGGGGSVVFNSSDSSSGYGSALGGFGIAGGTGRNFTYLAPNAGGTLAFTNSSIIAGRNTWYEMALVIRLDDATNYASSLGYLYYRALGDTEFSVLPEFNGVQMSWWTSSLNATDLAYYRIDNARNGFQFDNFSAGMVIPEPSVGMLSGAALITLSFFAMRRKK